MSLGVRILFFLQFMQNKSIYLDSSISPSCSLVNTNPFRLRHTERERFSFLFSFVFGNCNFIGTTRLASSGTICNTWYIIGFKAFVWLLHYVPLLVTCELWSAKQFVALQTGPPSNPVPSRPAQPSIHERKKVQCAALCPPGNCRNISEQRIWTWPRFYF